MVVMVVVLGGRQMLGEKHVNGYRHQFDPTYFHQLYPVNSL